MNSSPYGVLTALALVVSVVGCDELKAEDTKDDRPPRPFEATDEEGDWGETCSNGDFEGTEGPPEMDITGIQVSEFDTSQQATVNIEFKGDVGTYLESFAAGMEKPNVSVQLTLSNGAKAEVILQNDCTWKAVDGILEVDVGYGLDDDGTGAIGLIFRDLQSADIESVKVEAFDYDVLGERDGTYCDEATASAPAS